MGGDVERKQCLVSIGSLHNLVVLLAHHPTGPTRRLLGKLLGACSELLFLPFAPFSPTRTAMANAEDSSDGKLEELERINRALGRLDSHLRRMTDREPTGSLASTAYRPWSRIDYVRRAQSFHWSWSSRDPACGVVLCARYGWCQRGGETGAEEVGDTNNISVGRAREINAVHCCCCGEELYLPWDEELTVDTRIHPLPAE